MLTAFVICEKRSSMGGPPECTGDGMIEVPAVGDAVSPDVVRQGLTERGWVIQDGMHYCPRHRPADAGITFEWPVPDGNYHPIASSGWEARSSTSTTARLEVRPIRPREVGT